LGNTLAVLLLPLLAAGWLVGKITAFDVDLNVKVRYRRWDSVI
jgi:hypothetical protein